MMISQKPIWKNDIICYPFFENYMPLEKPPTLANVLNAILATKNGEKPRVKDLPRLGRTYVFEISYPLDSSITRSSFEENFIRHFLLRRIGTETFTSFTIELGAKLNEIMPKYNLMFKALGEEYDLFSGGSYTLDITEHEETSDDTTGSDTERTTDNQTRNGTGSTETESTVDGTSDDRRSDTPQNHLENVRNGEYVTDYAYNTTETNSTVSSDTTSQETTSATGQKNINRTENKDGERDFTRHEVKTSTIDNKTDMLLKYQNEAQSIISMIYKDCDECFLQIM